MSVTANELVLARGFYEEAASEGQEGGVLGVEQLEAILARVVEAAGAQEGATGGCVILDSKL